MTNGSGRIRPTSISTSRTRRRCCGVSNAATWTWGERWEELAEACAGKIEDHALAFTEPHHVMALGRAGRFEEVDRVLESLERCAGERSTYAASIARRLTIPLCRAVAAYCRGDYDEVTALLLPIRCDYPLMGASHAQRDVFAQLLNEAALRGRRFRLARGLLAERVELRPSSPDSWSKYADALDGCGEAEAGASARARAGECRAAAA